MQNEKDLTKIFGLGGIIIHKHEPPKIKPVITSITLKEEQEYAYKIAKTFGWINDGR